MNTRRLFIFVEGNDDHRFFSRVIRPPLENSYASVEIIMYASMKTVNVCRFVRSITAMNHDFILCADIDQERTVRGKKGELKTRFCTLADDRIVVIIQEIESWYLAGLDEKAQKRYSLQPYHSTNHITKEIFNRMIPRYYTSRITFMADILSQFATDVAKERNRSFRYFYTRFIQTVACEEKESREKVLFGGQITGREKSGGDDLREQPGESGLKRDILHPDASGSREDS